MQDFKFLLKLCVFYFRFFPLQRVVDVSSKTLNNVNFLQLKATLKGTIVCLPDKESKSKCSEAEVTLKMIDGVAETKTANAHGMDKFLQKSVHDEMII